MAYNTNEVLKDVDGNPISQYYDPISDSYKPVEGSNGGNKVTVENNDLSLIPILDKLSQLTGTVIDEETRKSNETTRKSNESSRVSVESDRVSAENTRVGNENTRKTQESDRVSAESSRVNVESSRVSAENTRVSNEDTRKSNETSRESSEATRISNEDTRKSNESSRQSSETIRNTNEDSRIDNEDIRESNEVDRIGNESAREGAESTRESQELGRVSAESDRVSAETSRESAESTRVSQESTRQSQESSRQSNEGVRESQESNRESNEDLRIALYDDLLSKVTSGFFKGEKGDTGNGLEYTWNGSQLGVRVEGTTEYVYVDLKGEKGDTGEIENLTSNHVTDALGFTPLSEDSLPSNLETTTGSQAKADTAETNAKNHANTELAKKVDKVSGKGLSTNDYTTTEKNKLSGIATGANNYTHPTSHPASIITETSSKRFVTDSEKTSWNNKASTNTTYSEISTTEINAGTSSTLRTISGRRVQAIVDKARSSTTKSDVGLGSVDNLSAASIRSGTTKANVGLGNVDNIKQMPISGGVLENYREKLTTVSATGGSINLSLGNVFQHTPSGNRTYSITNAVSGQAHSFTLIINMGAYSRTLTFPSSVKWQGGEIPDMSTTNKTYVLTFMSVNGGSTWLGMFGGEF